MRVKPAGYLILMLLSVVGMSGRAGAVVVFSNLGPNDSYLVGSGLTMGGPNQFQEGLAFAPSASGTLSAIRLAAGRISGTSADLSLDLYSDNAGALGALMRSFQTQMLGFAGNNNPLIEIIVPDTNTLLSQGQQYWLVASIPDGNLASWNHNLNLIDGPRLVIDSGSPNYSFEAQGAFEVQVANAAVPEPSTVFLLGVGGLTAWGAARRRREKGQVGSEKGAEPELPHDAAPRHTAPRVQRHRRGGRKIHFCC